MESIQEWIAPATILAILTWLGTMYWKGRDSKDSQSKTLTEAEIRRIELANALSTDIMRESRDALERARKEIHEITQKKEVAIRQLEDEWAAKLSEVEQELDRVNKMFDEALVHVGNLIILVGVTEEDQAETLAQAVEFHLKFKRYLTSK